MEDKHEKSKVRIVLVDPMATATHLHSLDKCVSQAHTILGRVFGVFDQKPVDELTESDVERMAELYIQQFSGDASMLDESAFRGRIESLLNSLFTEGSVPVHLGMQHLFGLTVALSLRPLPIATSRGFFLEGNAEA